MAASELIVRSEETRPGERPELVDIAVLLSDAVTTDGAHHKQWYLERLAAVFGVTLPDHAAGIAP